MKTTHGMVLWHAQKNIAEGINLAVTFDIDLNPIYFLRNIFFLHSTVLNRYKVFFWFYLFHTRDCNYCLIFFSLCERFPAFIENNRIGSLVDHLFGIKILILFFLCDHLLIMVWMASYSIFLHHLLAMVHYLILLWQFLVLHQNNYYIHNNNQEINHCHWLGIT